MLAHGSRTAEQGIALQVEKSLCAMPQFASSKNKDLGEALLRFWTHSLAVQNRCATGTYQVHKLQAGSRNSNVRQGKLMWDVSQLQLAEGVRLKTEEILTTIKELTLLLSRPEVVERYAAGVPLDRESTRLAQTSLFLSF